MKKIQSEVTTQVIGYVVAALGLVAGLAWNDAIKTLIEFLFPMAGGNSVIIKFGYAFLITAVVVLITLLLTRAMRKKGE
ncbi:hypothetical protein KJ641_02440 [Patescibacteria group bacterium]|nr:hypothetical protein [Patescibacteria group bacterium]MBU1895703.1 hypothetical protein [Patescibacteria group bacterium]